MMQQAREQLQKENANADQAADAEGAATRKTYDNTQALKDFENSQKTLEKTGLVMDRQKKLLFPRLSEEASDAEFDEVADETEGDLSVGKNTMNTTSDAKAAAPMKKEVGFKYQGEEPTRFTDWAHKGRVTDF